jgi:hypothetical protein
MVRFSPVQHFRNFKCTFKMQPAFYELKNMQPRQFLATANKTKSFFMLDMRVGALERVLRLAPDASQSFDAAQPLYNQINIETLPVSVCVLYGKSSNT